MKNGKFRHNYKVHSVNYDHDGKVKVNTNIINCDKLDINPDGSLIFIVFGDPLISGGYRETIKQVWKNYECVELLTEEDS